MAADENQSVAKNVNADKAVVACVINAQEFNVGTTSAPGGAHQPPAPLPIPSVVPCIGRDQEVATLADNLLAEKLAPIAILGAPGIGKTTLALTALRDSKVKARYGDRRFFVRCDGARTRSELAMELGRAVGLSPSPQVEAASLSELNRSPAVLVLDNAETPLDADSHAVEELLALLAGIEAMALVCTLRGATQPAAGLIRWFCVRPWALSMDAAKEAFLAIAGPQFALDPHLPDVLGVTGGVPLAITLLARVAQGQPHLDFIWRRWQEVGTKLAVAGGGAHRLDNIEISYELSIEGPRMSDPARRLLSLLGVLPSGVALQDIAAVLPDVGEEAALTLRQVGLAFDETDRLRVLAPLREHLQRNRQPADDDKKRIARHYCNLAAVEGRKVGAAGGAQAVQRLAPETANIETMILEMLKDGDILAVVSTVLGWGEFIRFTGVGEAKLLLEVAAAANLRGLVDQYAVCTEKAGDIALRRSDHAGAKARYEEALPLYRRVGAVLGEANCIKSLGDIALARSDHAGAKARYEEALPLYERIEEPYSIGVSHVLLARVASDPRERKRHLVIAREAWTSIDRPDLVAKLLLEE